MNNEDKISCWISWNIFLRVLVLILLLGIVFNIFKIEKVTIFQLASGIGALIGFYLFYQRNKIFEQQLKQKDEQYTSEMHFKSFLETSTLLTDKDSTVEAKISAMYLLYDIAKKQPHDIERIIQILNKQLTYLFTLIEKDKISKQEIKEWKYKGDDREKIISNSLIILKKIIVNYLFLTDVQKNKIDISNSILFDIDLHNYKENLYIKKIETPIENIIFLYAQFYHKKKKYHTEFKKIKIFFSQFIRCDLTKVDFSDSNIWGTSFKESDLKDVNFKNCECESVEFVECKNLFLKQIKDMKFEFKDIVAKLKDKVAKLKNKDENIKNKYQLNRYINILDDNFYPIIIKNINGFEDISFLSSREENKKFNNLKVKLYKEFL